MDLANRPKCFDKVRIRNKASGRKQIEAAISLHSRERSRHKTGSGFGKPWGSPGNTTQATPVD